MTKKIKVSTNANPKQKLFTPQVFLIALIVVVLFFVIIIHSRHLNKKSLQYTEQIEQLDEQIEAAQKKAKDLKKQEQYQQTSEFKEEIARTQLGMIKPNEKIFQPAQ